MKKIALAFFILASAVGLYYFTRSRLTIEPASPRKATKILIAQIESSLELFKTDCSRYPTSAEGFKPLLEKPSDCPSWGPEPYLTELPVDGWGHALRYTLIDQNTFEVKSLGQDGNEGGTDADLDITSGSD